MRFPALERSRRFAETASILPTLDRPGNQVRIRLRSTAVRVEHEGDPEKSSFVRVMYTRDGKVYRLKARTVIMAGGGWITKHVVRDLPSTHREAYDQFNYTATLVANVAVRNWRFLHKLGLSGGRWFEGFGFWTEVRTIAKFGADSPTHRTGLTHRPVASSCRYYYPGLPMPEQCSKGPRGDALHSLSRLRTQDPRAVYRDVCGVGF